MYSQATNLENYMNRNDYDKIIDKAKDIQKEWRTIPAPRRGDLIRVFGMSYVLI